MHKDACRFKTARAEETPDERMTREQNGTLGAGTMGENTIFHLELLRSWWWKENVQNTHSSVFSSGQSCKLAKNELLLLNSLLLKCLISGPDFDSVTL